MLYRWSPLLTLRGAWSWLASDSPPSYQVGLQQIVRFPQLVASLALNMDCEDVAICTQTLELLAVMMVTGVEGHRVVLDAMEFFKVKMRRYRCASVVVCLISGCG